VVVGFTSVFWPLLVVLCAKQVLAPSNNKNVQVRQVKVERIPIVQKHRHGLTYQRSVSSIVRCPRSRDIGQVVFAVNER
jgi:hypothetical protein